MYGWKAFIDQARDSVKDFYADPDSSYWGTDGGQLLEEVLACILYIQSLPTHSQNSAQSPYRFVLSTLGETRDVLFSERSGQLSKDDIDFTRGKLALVQIRLMK